MDLHGHRLKPGERPTVAVCRSAAKLHSLLRLIDYTEEGFRRERTSERRPKGLPWASLFPGRCAAKPRYSLFSKAFIGLPCPEVRLPVEDRSSSSSSCLALDHILAPRSFAVVARVWASPPPAGIFFSFPSAKKPTHLLSGDQNGAAAPSVPGIMRAVISSIVLVQRIGRLPRRAATNTILRPSGDIAN